MSGRQLARICAAAMMVAVSACSGATRVRDDIHRDSWHELTSPHIKLITDLDGDSADEHVRDLEQTWRALNAAYVVIAPWFTPVDGQFAVIHLRDCYAFEEIAPKNAGGFVFSSLDFTEERIAVTCGRGSAHEVIVHELAHLLNHRCFPMAPSWLDEGLATYFETLKLDGDRATIGELPRAFAGVWRKPAWLPSMSQLIALDYEGFHSHGDSQEGRNYYAAWKLIHLLNNTRPEYQNRLRGYLAMLNGQRERKNAWELAFRGIPADQLAEEYAAYERHPELQYWAIRYRPEHLAAPQVRQLGAGEAHAVWAHLLARTRPSEALQQLDLAGQVDPAWAEAYYWRALLLLRSGAEAQAAAALREYRSRRPDDVRGWFVLLAMELRRVVPAEHLGLEDTPPAGIDELESIAKGLVDHATRSSDLNLAAWYYAMARHAEKGLPLATRSVQADPACGACWDTLALLYFQAGDAARALLAQERAANMYSDAETNPGMRARLERYRAAASAAAE